MHAIVSISYSSFYSNSKTKIKCKKGNTRERQAKSLGYDYEQLMNNLWRQAIKANHSDGLLSNEYHYKIKDR